MQWTGATWMNHECVLDEARRTCLDCVRKHLAQALVLMEEVQLGYPEHKWIAIGHLAEASAESATDHPDLASKIRRHRLRYMADENYQVPILELIAEATKLAKAK